MSYVKGSQLPATSTVADTDTLIVTQEGDSKATKKVAKSDLLKEDRTRLTNLETDNTTNKSNITNLQQENQTLKNNVKALEYVINNSNRLNYTGEIITNSNSAVGDIRNITVSGNTHYKKSDGTYTDTWEDGVSLESLGEKEKNADKKYPIEIVSINNAKNLIKSDNILDGYYYDNNNTLQPNSSFQTLKKAISVQSNKTYYVVNSSNTKINVTYILYYATDGSVIKCEYDKNIITIPSNCTSIRFSTGGLKNLCFSLSENYSVYTFDKRTILLENPLRKNGSISDFADLEKKEVTRNCGVKILDGSETWGKESLTRTNTSLFYLSLTSSIFAKAGKCLSDKLSYNYNIYSTDEEGIRIDVNGNLQISILKSKLATDNVTGFKTWLVSNNVTVVYQLATPITEDIEVSPTDNPLTSYTPSTTLTTNNAIKGNISADMPTNLSGVITQQASLIAQLEDNLLQTQALLIDNAIDNA